MSSGRTRLECATGSPTTISTPPEQWSKQRSPRIFRHLKKPSCSFRRALNSPNSAIVTSQVAIGTTIAGLVDSAQMTPATMTQGAAEWALQDSNLRLQPCESVKNLCTRRRDTTSGHLTRNNDNARRLEKT